MQQLFRRVTVVVFTGVLLTSISVSQAEKTFSHGLFAELLRKYVNDGMVDYKGFKDEEQQLDRYLELLNKANPEALSRDERFAFYMNAYNAYTIKLILINYPVKSIKNTGSLLKSPWKISFVKIGGKTLTLDDVEHNILRPTFQDARVHFAINCAAKDCPPLYPETFEGDIVDEQLEKNTRAFLNNREKTIWMGRFCMSLDCSNGLAVISMTIL